MSVSVREMMTDPELVRAFKIRRPSGSFGNEGVYTSTYKTIDLTGIVQPANPRDVQLLPEGDRSTEIISVWSACRISAADGNKAEADIVLLGEKSYRAIKEVAWGAEGGGYFKVLAQRFQT